MYIKDFVPLGLLATVIYIACSPTSPSPPSPNDAQIAKSAPAAETPEAMWGDDMTYGYLFDEEEALMAFVRATLGSRQEAYMRYGVGNLAFA